MKRIWIIVTALSLIGCTGLQHSNVAGLGESQDAYFAELTERIKANRGILATALEQQEKSNQERRRRLFDWERDLVKAEVLIAAGDQVQGRKALLLMKTAELDLASLDRAHSFNEIDRARIAAILTLYDEIGKAAITLQKNNNAITAYLAANNEEFVLRSLDVGGIVRVASAIRQAEEEVRSISDDAKEKRRNEEARVEQGLDRVRDIMLSVFTKD